MGYHYVRLSADRITDLGRLFSSVYGLPVDEVALLRKFDTSAFGASYIAYLAYPIDADEPAAFYGVFPIRVRLDGRECLAAQSGDTMTHPDHRGKGLFVELAKRTYELAMEMDIAFVFGYPNANSYPGFVRRLGWKHPFDMKAWNVVVPTLPVGRLLVRSTLGDAYSRYVQRVAGLLFDVFQPKDLASEFDDGRPENAVCHGEVFLRYKGEVGLILRHGTASIWAKVDGDMCIGYATDSASGRDISAALRRLRILSMLAGLPRLKSYYSPEGHMDRLLGSTGFIRKGTAFGYLSFDPDLDPGHLDTSFVDYDTF